MVRQAEAEEFLLKHLTKISSDFKCAIGLIIGQANAHKFNVVHLARTPTSDSNDDQTPPNHIASIVEVNQAWVVDHARQTLRMLSGGMYVLGVFVVGDEEIFNPFHPKIKSILTGINKTLQADKYLFGGDFSEKLVLSFAPKSQRWAARAYDVASANVQPVDWKFLPKATKFIVFECTYQIQHVYHLKTGEADGPLKSHVKAILDDIEHNLQSAVLLFDNDLKDADEKLENVGKKKKTPRTNSSKSAPEQAEAPAKPVAVSIFEKCVRLALKPLNSLHQAEFEGDIRVEGEVISKLWLNPKGTFGEAMQAVREDIMRSLATRMELHWDSLIEEELREDVNSVHEPPRRALIALPDSNVGVSDYLFSGEAPEDAKFSLQELFGVKTDDSLEVLDLEAQADIALLYDANATAHEADQVDSKSASDSSKFMYILGLVAAIIILFVSIFVHFYLKYV
ncbi:hypothetical protein HUJ04_005659 [Dendroctonus ponderosae]